MKSIKVLDVTLRDGGCVIDFNFGSIYMNKILSALENSKLDIIELGYIDDKKGSEKDRTQYKNERVIESCLLKEKKNDCKYVAMIDYGKFNPNQLSVRDDNSIDGIRFCFHKKDYRDAIEQAKVIAAKGYDLYIQPMITLRYSEEEFLSFTHLINKEIPFTKGVYIVDSFGEMREEELFRLFDLLNSNLNDSISIGFHSHNNLQLSYSNVIALLKKDYIRNVIIDSSIMGMGKGAGNLNTELLLEHLNRYYGFEYNIDPLLDVIDKVIKPIHAENYWGYSVEYFLSSKYHCTPSYASYFYNKHMLSIADVSTLLSMIDDSKKISFDKTYAEQLYEAFNANKDVDDSKTISLLGELVNNKKVIIIAPGKNINDNRQLINSYLNDKSFVSFSLNIVGTFDVNYKIVTRSDLINNEENVIYSSNLLNRQNNLLKYLSYKKWIIVDEDGVHDSSSVILINALLALGVKELFLAGFDGFSVTNSENYYESELRNSLDNKQVLLRNNFYKKYFKDISKKIKITFITRSVYED